MICQNELCEAEFQPPSNRPGKVFCSQKCRKATWSRRAGAGPIEVASVGVWVGRGAAKKWVVPKEGL